MPIESANYISQLVITYPESGDQYNTVDDQFRLIKKVMRQSLPNLNSEMSASTGELNYVVGLTANAQSQINALNSSFAALSQTFQTEINSLSSVLQASKLNVSATAYAAVLWGGSAKYIQTATPTLTANAIWFQPN